MIYLITNRKLVNHGTLLDVIEKAALAGVRAVILREKDLCQDELIALGTKLKEVLKATKTPLMVNGNLKAAKAIGAEGYHASFNNFISEKPDFTGTLGVSIHSLEEAIISEEKGADYLLVGHIFETDCKKGLPPKGVSLIKSIKDKVKIPVIALGGIKPENIEEVFSAGADGAAVMSSIMMAEDPFKEITNLKRI